MAGDPWAYTPPLSLWQLVEQHVSPEQQDEIKSMLGTSLVETTLDLHNEIKMLLEIWQDYKDETESESHKPRPLAEPPLVRDRLIQEICFLAANIRKKSASKGVNSSVLLSRHNSDILDYAEQSMRSGSSLGSTRPQSARSSDGRQTPISTSEHASSRIALDSTICEEVSTANDKLNYLQFDEVCTSLRDILTKEMEQLEADVVFLHACLNDELDDRGHGGISAQSREPTLTDLREERSLLEKDLLSTNSLPNTPPVKKAPFLPGSASSGVNKMQTLSPVNPKLKPAHTNSTAGTSKNVPLKASHCVAHTLTRNSADSISSGDTSSVSDMPFNNTTNTKTSQIPDQSNGKSNERSYHKHSEKDDSRKKHEGSGFHQHMHSPSRIKVVPVGSVLEPRVDSAGSQRFIPTPPSAEESPHLSRPNSAQRFRRMVMSHRDSS